MAKSALVGVWDLVSYEMTSADRVVLPLGGDPVGVGVYTTSGQMSAHLMAARRPPFGEGRRPGADPIAPELIAQAAAGYIGYCGRYEVDEAQSLVSHFVDAAFIPDWVGTVMARTYEFRGDLLILRPPPRNGFASELVWRRRA